MVFNTETGMSKKKPIFCSNHIFVLGIDRDSGFVADLFSEKNKSVMELISTVIDKARTAGVKIGLCGQAPSDLPEFAEFLVKNGINSISFNPDSILRGIENIRKAENELLLKV